MDTMKAFEIGRLTQDNTAMVFDWVKAAKYIVEHNVKNARAGLQYDLEYTSDSILVDGKIPEYSYTFLASTWAVPVLIIGNQEMPCYIMEDQTSWHEKTFWPDEARQILKGG